jgi:hypothetical protein
MSGNLPIIATTSFALISISDVYKSVVSGDSAAPKTNVRTIRSRTRDSSATVSSDDSAATTKFCIFSGDPTIQRISVSVQTSPSAEGSRTLDVTGETPEGRITTVIENACTR